MTFEVYLPVNYDVAHEFELILDTALLGQIIVSPYVLEYSTTSIHSAHAHVRVEITTETDEDAITIKLLTSHLLENV